MPKHIVRRGECIDSIAAHYGVTPAALKAKNEELFRSRSGGYVLKVGDVVDAPTVGEASRKASFSAGGTVRYKATIPSTTLKVKVVDDAGEPVKSQPFKVVGSRVERTGTTDGDGFVIAKLPVHVTTATLEVQFPEDEEPHTFTLKLGHLDPVTELSGVRQRLVNLGWLGHTTASDDEVVAAVRRWQRAKELTVTGRLDDAGREQLVSDHGS